MHVFKEMAFSKFSMEKQHVHILFLLCADWTGKLVEVKAKQNQTSFQSKPIFLNSILGIN
jgi:hypothetical protein